LGKDERASQKYKEALKRIERMTYEKFKQPPPDPSDEWQLRAENAVHKIATVPVESLSEHLSEVNGDVKARLLIPSKKIADIFNCESHLLNFPLATSQVLSIRNHHQIHYNNQFLSGLKLHDRQPGTPDTTYEKEWCKDVSNAVKSAEQEKKNVIVGFAAANSRIVFGRDTRNGDIVFEDNLQALKDKVQVPFDLPKKIMTSTEVELIRDSVYGINLKSGTIFNLPKNQCSSFRPIPVALEILPPQYSCP